jgi:formate hydrogenlyase subunit 5
MSSKIKNKLQLLEKVKINKDTADELVAVSGKDDFINAARVLIEEGYHFSNLIVEESDNWQLNYVFIKKSLPKLAVLKINSPLSEKEFTSLTPVLHGADWLEREAEDMYGITFSGHPRLGDFILHDDVWQEGLTPMAHTFNPHKAKDFLKPQKGWKPHQVVDISGAFLMPIGPIFSGHAESVHLQLETIGEEIIRVFPRLFFKYRAVEKRLENVDLQTARFIIERFSGDNAFSHAWAFSQAVEKSQGIVPSDRAEVLRVYFAELERIRNHLKTLEGICSSTALTVAANQIAILEEEVLRIIGSLVGHRYFFGLVSPGGLERDFSQDELVKVLKRVKEIVEKANHLEELLKDTSSFLDRLEEVGIISEEEARNYSLVGPIARASNYSNDVRETLQYSLYKKIDFSVVTESEGDGYARLRVFFAELREAYEIMEKCLDFLPAGEVKINFKLKEGSALSAVEAPRGAFWCYLKINSEGKLTRCRLLPPSFMNWHGYHLAVENFAFQDLPIIMATLGLSVAENDR